MKIVISGGTGFIGQHLVPALLNDGHEVVILTRHPQEHQAASPQQRYVAFDADAPGQWAGEIDGAGAVINLAGANLGAGRWTEKRKKVLLDSRVETTRALVAAVEQARQRPAVFISASAVGYYGARGDEVLDEASAAGDNFLAEVCIAWERAAAPVEALGVRLVFPRLGVVWGEDADALKKMVLPFKLFAGGPVGSGKQWLSWVHIDDVIGFVRFAQANERVSGVVNLTAPNPVQNKELAQTFGRILGRPAFLPAPAFAVKLVLGEQATIVLDGQRVLPRRLQELGYTFAFRELEPALRDVLGT